MSTIEKTECLFNTKSKCLSPKRTNLNMLVCQKHLRDYYGLEMGFHQEDNATNVAYVGGFLRPVKNIGYFTRNTVIIPTNHFFDRTLRPESYPDHHDSKFRKYQMNPIILEYIRKYGNNVGKSVDYRVAVDTIRNLIPDHDKMAPGPNQESQHHTLYAVIRSKKSISESLIRDESIFKVLDHFSIYMENDEYKAMTNVEALKTEEQLVHVKTLPISIAMKYILCNMLYSEMEIIHNSYKFPDYLNFNCKYIPSVGLVATENINHPHFLIIDGLCRGHQIIYNAMVSLVQKEVVHRNYTLKDIPPQYALTDGLKDGVNC